MSLDKFDDDHDRDAARASGPNRRKGLTVKTITINHRWMP